MQVVGQTQLHVEHPHKPRSNKSGPEEGLPSQSANIWTLDWRAEKCLKKDGHFSINLQIAV